MNEDDFTAKLGQLMSEMHDLPPSEQEKVRMLADETRERQEKLKKTVCALQESLDYLRVSVKYLVFDLEATRRENAYLRKLMEQTPPERDE